MILWGLNSNPTKLKGRKWGANSIIRAAEKATKSERKGLLLFSVTVLLTEDPRPSQRMKPCLLVLSH